MHHVIVYYQPAVYDQQHNIAHLKRCLPEIVARVFSDRENCTQNTFEQQPDITITPDMVMVTEYAALPTDINVPNLEIHIHAGERRRRNWKINQAVAKELYMNHLSWINNGRGAFREVGIFVMWHDENDYQKAGDFGPLD